MNNNSNSQYAGKSNAELLAIINGLEAAAEAKKNRKLEFKISENKGGLYVGGWNMQFPLSMYLSQFDRLVAQFDELKAFVAKYRKHFAVKGETWNPAVSLAGLPEGVIARIKEKPAPKAS